MVEVAVGAALLGGVMQMQGIKAAAKGQAAAKTWNSQVRERNAASLDNEAQWQELIGDLDILDFREDFARLEGDVSAKQLKGGFTQTGTNVDVMIENAKQADEEIAYRKVNTYVAAQQIRERGINERLAADLDRMDAANIKTAGRYRARAAAVGTISRAAYMLV